MGTLQSNTQNLEEFAKNINQLMQGIKIQCEQAKAVIPNNYALVVRLPVQIYNFNELLTRATAAGFTTGRLGRKIVAEYYTNENEPWATYQADFASFVNNINTLDTLIRNNSTEFKFTNDATGNPEFNVPLTTPQNNALIGALDNILNLWA